MKVVQVSLCIRLRRKMERWMQEVSLPKPNHWNTDTSPTTNQHSDLNDVGEQDDHDKHALYINSFKMLLLCHITHTVACPKIMQVVETLTMEMMKSLFGNWFSFLNSIYNEKYLYVWCSKFCCFSGHPTPGLLCWDRPKCF